MPKNPSKILPLVSKHEKLRSSGINLIASENWLSPEVRNALSSDLAGRYHSSWYGGTKYAQRILEETAGLACKVFGARYAIVTALSGNLCDLAAMFAFTREGDGIAMVPKSAGGYPLGTEKFGRARLDLPLVPDTVDVDAKAAARFVAKRKPALTILGSSFIVFPHPVSQLEASAKSCGRLVYDGSHVLGLIAGGEFQKPLDEGAQVLIGSTHKTLPGPQGGLVLTNSKELHEALESYLYFIDGDIGLVDNPHPSRIAALGVALEEMLRGGKQYARATIRNAQALASALDEGGVPVKFRERGFTRSHQVLLDISDAEATKFCRALEKVGIFMDVGGRLGAAEMTHRGANIYDMESIAELMARVYYGKTESVAADVKRIAKSFNP